MLATQMEWSVVVRAARAGDRAATGWLLKEFEVWLLCFIRVRLRREVRTVEDEKDVAQLVWIIFFGRGLPEHDFATAEAVRGYLTRTAEYVLSETHRNHLQRQKRDRRRARSMEDVAGDHSKGLEVSDSPCDRAASREAWERAQGRLTAMERELMRWIERTETVAEAAQQLGLNDKETEALLQSAQKKIKASLTGHREQGKSEHP